MATSESKNKLECSICLSAFRDPKLLPCYHTFCLECLVEFVSRNAQNGKFECPLCRVGTAVPEGGVKAFQSNFYIQVGDLSGTDIDCDVCGSGNTATHYCVDCEEYFCERCSNAHMKMKVSREHKILQTDKTGEHAGKIRQKHYCLCHSGEEIKMNCKDCNALLCVICKLTEHENHNTIGIVKEAAERRVLLSTKVEEIKKVVDKIKCNILKADECLKRIETDEKASIDAIDKRTESLIANIQDNARTLRQGVITKSTKAKDYYSQNQKLLQNELSEIQEIINHATNVHEFWDDTQILDRGLLPKLESTTSSKMFQLKDYEQLTFKAGNSEIRITQIGQLVLINDNLCSIEELNEVTGNIKPDTKKADVLSLVADNLCIAFSNSDKIYNHEVRTSETRFANLTGGVGNCLGLKYVNNDVHFTTKNDKSLYKYNFVKKACARLKGFKKYPHGIDYISESKTLLVCLLNNQDRLNDCLGSVFALKLGDEHHYIWRNAENPGPACVAVNNDDGTVCLGYPAAHRVTLNALNGDVLSEFTGVGCQGNSDVFCPVSVCFDSHSCIIVADYRNNALIRINKWGSYMQCLVKEKAPLCVTFGDNNMLYVGYENKNITQYQIQITHRKVEQ